MDDGGPLCGECRYGTSSREKASFRCDGRWKRARGVRFAAQKGGRIVFRDAATSTSASRAGYGGVDVYCNWCARMICCDRAVGWAGVQSGRAQEKALQDCELRRKGGPQLQLAKARRPVSAP